MNKKNFAQPLLVLAVLTILVLSIHYAFGVPEGASLSYIANETKAGSSPGVFNQTFNATTGPGGYIFTLSINTTQQNLRWKGVVGNVSGKLVLDDANSNTLYDWTMSTVQGAQVYASRSNSIEWSGINCSFTNATEYENYELNQSNADDNITATFDGVDNSQFYVGTRLIGASSCPTTHMYINSSGQSAQFEEVLLYDGDGIFNQTASNFSNIVYATISEDDIRGFDGNTDNNTYDFQMILPENGLSSWTSSIAYYFYIELP